MSRITALSSVLLALTLAPLPALAGPLAPETALLAVRQLFETRAIETLAARSPQLVLSGVQERIDRMKFDAGSFSEYTGELTLTIQLLPENRYVVVSCRVHANVHRAPYIKHPREVVVLDQGPGYQIVAVPQVECAPPR